MDNAFLMGEASAGLTFLDWSLYYFSGTTRFFNPMSYTWETLVDNPVGTHNAHHHNRIHPNSLHLLKFCINNTADKGTFHSIYAASIVLPNSDIHNVVNFLRDGKYDKQTKWSEYKLSILNSFREINDYIITQGHKLVLLRNNKEDYLYSMFNANRPWGTTVDEETIMFYNKFFNKDNSVIDKWDIRERIALSYRPFETTQFDFVATKNHYEITVNSMLDNLDKEIYNILDFFNITPVGNYDYWLTLYRQWQQMHDIKFYRNWKEILTKIVDGENYDLVEYDLNFTKDVFIQHILLHKYNLNIKGYGVDSLPTNTRMIHHLLEPNVHELNQEYIKELCLNY